MAARDSVVAKPEPSWVLLDSLGEKLEAGQLNQLSQSEVSYLRKVACGLGFTEAEVLGRTASIERQLGLLRDSRARVREGSRMLMAAIVHAELAADDDELDSARAEFLAILKSPVDFYRDLAANELRKLERRRSSGGS